jgi:DNA-binding HxlR family transcriptional regulator
MDQSLSRGGGNCYKADCPARAIWGHVTGRWGGLVLGALRNGKLRYSELRKRIEGVSEKMLAQTLRDLEGDGLIRRHQHAVIPPRVDYELTAHGREVANRLGELIGWLEANIGDLVDAQKSYRTRARKSSS